MEPHGQSPWYLHEIPSYACLRVAPPSEVSYGGQALRRRQAKASEGYPPVATSAGAPIAFIVRRHRLWPTASTVKPVPARRSAIFRPFSP